MGSVSGWVCCVLENVSIVIPVAVGEVAHEVLLGDLEGLGSEIIISSEGTRAASLNAGAARAGRKFIWFLHADSRVDAMCFEALAERLERTPEGLHYFDLGFDGGGLMAVNAVGANVRSRLFGWAYGDQGFCISQAQFEAVGGYREDVVYGEDLLFVRTVRVAGVSLRRVPARIVTSARKYRDGGWVAVTWAHWRGLFSLLRVKI